MLNTITKLNSFVNNNVDYFLTELKVEEHPVNRENVKEWLNSHSPSDSLLDYTIAKIISNNIQNVSYTDVITKLNDIANDLFTLTNEVSSNEVNLYLFLPYLLII